MSTILVVDDDWHMTEALSRLLRLEGYTMFTANKGSIAIAMAQELKPDLILLDIMMPDMSGYEICEAIKSIPLTAKIPVLMLSALDSGDDVDRALEKKADWYVLKPYDERYLLKKIRQFLRSPTGERP